MKLNIKDRLVIIQILPQTGSISEMVDVMEIVKKVRLSAEEKVEINYVETSNSASWNAAVDQGKDIEFSLDELNILRSAVKKLDEEKQINISNLDLCLKINKL